VKEFVLLGGSYINELFMRCQLHWHEKVWNLLIQKVVLTLQLISVLSSYLYFVYPFPSNSCNHSRFPASCRSTIKPVNHIKRNGET
jgi:hypothetical protein